MNIKDPSFCRLHTLFKRHFLGYKILIMRHRETVSFSTWIFKFMLRFFSWSKLTFSSTCSPKARDRINPTTLNILGSQLCCVPQSLGLRVTSNQFSHNIIKSSPNNLCCYHHHHPVLWHNPFTAPSIVPHLSLCTTTKIGRWEKTGQFEWANFPGRRKTLDWIFRSPQAGKARMVQWEDEDPTLTKTTKLWQGTQLDCQMQ